MNEKTRFWIFLGLLCASLLLLFLLNAAIGQVTVHS